MSEDSTDSFSGFVPMIDNISIGEPINMICTDGTLINASVFSVSTTNGQEYVFSIEEDKLAKLAFLIFKAASNLV